MYIIHTVFLCVGLRKKLEAAAKQKDCQLIGEWLRSIINHLYWCIVSTDPGETDMVGAKWLSLENHIHNVHSGHSDIFPSCLHDDLSGQNTRKKWFRRRKVFLMRRIQS